MLATSTANAILRQHFGAVYLRVKMIKQRSGPCDTEALSVYCQNCEYGVENREEKLTSANTHLDRLILLDHPIDETSLETRYHSRVRESPTLAVLNLVTSKEVDITTFVLGRML